LDDFSEELGRLTNWQRNQWARAGYPGIRSREVALVSAFRTWRRSGEPGAPPARAKIRTGSHGRTWRLSMSRECK
jgi:hypothetical protein